MIKFFLIVIILFFIKNSKDAQPVDGTEMVIHFLRMKIYIT